MVDSYQPIDIIVSAGRDRLTVRWSDGHESRFAAHRLRSACRSSAALRARIDGDAPDSPEDIRIAAVKPVGHYAINLVFSDGHDRGIYPWPYLRALDESRPDQTPAG